MVHSLINKIILSKTFFDRYHSEFVPGMIGRHLYVAKLILRKSCVHYIQYGQEVLSYKFVCVCVYICVYMWTSPDGQYQNHVDYILCYWRWISSIESAKTRPGADGSSDHELLIAKFWLVLKVGKSAWPFRDDLNQIPCDYTVKMMDRFKGLDLASLVAQELPW